MKRYRVYWTNSAIQDLAEIARYVGRERPIVAKSLIDKIELKSKALTTSPERCRVVAEIAEHGLSNFRELLVNPYRLIFRLAGRKIYVIAVLDGRRNIEDLLFQRLLRIAKKRTP